MNEPVNYLGGRLTSGLSPSFATPTVSVVVSTFNRPGMLAAALASIHAQTYGDFDLWVIDDCSTESGVEGVLAYWTRQFDQRGTPMYSARTPFPSGYQCIPKNAGIFYSRGEFIAYLDDDNTWEPEHLARMMGAFTPDVDMVYSGIRYVNQTDNPDLPTGERLALPWDPVGLLRQNYIDTSAMIHTRGAACMLSQDAYNVWDESLRRFADWNLVARFAQLGLRAKPVPEVFINYVWHGQNLQLTRKPAGVYAYNPCDAPELVQHA